LIQATGSGWWHPLAFKASKGDAQLLFGSTIYFLREGRMDEVAVFTNWRQDAESNGRFSVLQNNLPSVLVNYAYCGAGQYAKYKKVAKVVADFLNARVFFSSCWPSLDAISQETQTPIVFAGLVPSPLLKARAFWRLTSTLYVQTGRLCSGRSRPI
jgi:hypothetical protein